MRFHLLSIFLEPVVQFGWNLKWGTFSKKYLKRNSFQGQKGHIKATWLTFWPLFRNFSENSKSPIQKLPVFEKKVLKKFVPRPAAFKSTVSFITDFLWSYSSYLHQIWIIWLILHNLSFHEKKLTFKGQEGQERPCNFLFQNFWELRLMQNQFLSKKNHFWFIQNLNLVEFEGVYCTVAYPCWPLKAEKFSSKHFSLRKWSMVKI